MANQEHVNRLNQGVNEWNIWRQEHPDVLPDLRGAVFRNASLCGVDLNIANLRFINFYSTDLSGASLYKAHLTAAHLVQVRFVRADLREADLERANLRDANLAGADLRRASLLGADLARANLVGADFREADLAEVSLNEANLREVDLSNASLRSTIFAKVDLRSVKGLETVDHRGPSSIGFDTLALSRGEIPEVFLRGVGLSDTQIAYVRSLVSIPIEYYTCFISYSTRDKEFAERLYADLQSHNVRCWFAPEDLKIGDHYHQRIDESIRLYDKLVLILSEHAVQSAWVEREVVAAREREDREQRPVLFPIRLDEAVMHTTKAWAADVRRRWHIGDFTQWKHHDAYQQAFERLLRNLKADG